MQKFGSMRFLFNLILVISLLALATFGLNLAFKHFYKTAYPIHYIESVTLQSEKNSLPPSLVYAVIRTESGFNPLSVSSVEARGLMQITEDTYNWARFRLKEQDEASFDSLFDGDYNIVYGTAILRLLLDEFVTLENALCAYHAGWGNTKKWLKDPNISPDGKTITKIPFNDTAYYVNRVIEMQTIYQKLYNFE